MGALGAVESIVVVLVVGLFVVPIWAAIDAANRPDGSGPPSARAGISG